ncbi:MAG: aminotransferase class I/II-fold pyridoxal phosphate-dependent enzyme [Chitinophagales bacterium]|nr:aminotransferase class I/II-fold pyridoxal phosphate-dependent enzyme [Bacteroidota bacterium]MBK8486530.1 aminotransferase class I/II-fold pyridoxal phosphate-dependent enzyme [Bacteroidota bacterium]MBP7399763.1 aminotransferase class I/II-fold pyridoxal phosphate-dependent enzyme [Chitinophagales bacterium]
MLQFPGTIRSKLPNAGISIFSRMTALAHQHNAINLAQGFPDFPSSEKLIELVNHYMHQGMNQYAPMPGVMQLREAIAEKTEEIYSITPDPETEITIVSGATYGLYSAFQALLHEGNEVIVFEPAYDSYVPGITMAGGVPVPIQLQAPDYKINWDLVKKRINAHTRAIVLNSPQNPSGTVLKPNDLLQLAKLVKDTDIIIISDEVYEHIIFDGVRHEGVLHYPELAKRSVIISSFGKTFHNTGWKIGYVIAAKELTKEIRAVHQFMQFSVHTPSQYALADFLKDKQQYTMLPEFYQQKRDQFINLLQGSRFKWKPAAGTYFQLLDYSAISNKKDTDFANELTEKHKVASIPLSPFYHNNSQGTMLRFCFAKSDGTLEKAAAILQKI